MTELSPEAKKLMQIAREDFSPNAERVTAMRSALQQRLELGQGHGGNIGGGAAGTSTFVKLLGIGVIATAAALGVLSLSSHEAAPKTAADAQRAPVAVQAAQPQPQPAAQHGATNAPVSAAEPGVQPPVARTATATRSASPATPRRVARVARTATDDFEPTPARRSTSTRPRVAHAAHDGRATSTPASTPTPAAEQPEQPAAQDAKIAPPVDDSLARELALLTRARGALAHHDPATALKLADEHAAQFANGTMRQERVATRVLALCALGRRNDAIAAKHELERIAPRSPHLMRLRTSCAAEDTSSEVP